MPTRPIKAVTLLKRSKSALGKCCVNCCCINKTSPICPRDERNRTQRNVILIPRIELGCENTGSFIRTAAKNAGVNVSNPTAIFRMVSSMSKFSGERLGSGYGEREASMTQQMPFEPLSASVLFAHLVCFNPGSHLVVAAFAMLVISSIIQ